MLTKEEKKKIIRKYGKNKNNTGGVATQVALLTSRITYLTEHFKSHKSDFSAQKSLLYLVGKRKKFLKYLRVKNDQECSDLLSELKIRK
jgi:small subunit ribosomal protein S15